MGAGGLCHAGDVGGHVVRHAGEGEPGAGAGAHAKTQARLLSESSLAINAVAMQVGYQSFAYFSKIFRETQGMTPMAWRKQTKK